MPPLSIEPAALSSLLDSNVIEFLDLGCSTGKSCEFVRKATGMRIGVSLDSDAEKVEQCRKINDLSFVFDVSRLPRSRGTVSSSYMIHFLEHLAGPDEALEIIGATLEVTRDFILVRQPFFDHDEALARQGLKTYWSNWTGHRNPMRSADFAGLTDDPLVSRVRVWGIDPIESADNPAILPTSALPDQHAYDVARHGPKADTPITIPCYRETLVVIERPGLSDAGNLSLARILSSVQARTTLLSDSTVRPRRLRAVS